ncbi:xaa-Pro dipeptidase [Drosophila grimshawi]|uniref:Xaa-Pro dipeptidase n=1 Tax=Drosophila grimshawi TaxID=7222 RepID=B4JTP8_DROGR|nr:xaa-Pro dipeptidase [Drosophila grimshawi]EDV91477.1 GH17466 [Drosophila grimshawi]
MACFRMGSCHEVPMTLFKNNRDKVCKAIVAKSQEGLKLGTGQLLILLEGGKELSYYNTDVDYVFRQESYFQYMFGAKEPGCLGILNIDTKTGKPSAVLFVPRLPDEYETWMGSLLKPDEFKAMYGVDEVYYVDELETYLEKASPQLILTLSGTNSDSGLTMQPPEFAGKEKYVTNCDLLYPIISECRVIKSAEEIEVLRYVAKVSSDAHIKVMQFIRPGRMEYEGESVFLHHAYAVGGCRHASYTCICGSGTNSAILHYGHAGAPNNRPIQDGEMCLFDMGANYCGYAADITCSFPANGKFTEDQKFIYNAVLAARNAVMETARDGVSWVDMHKLAGKVLLERLMAGGLLNGDVDEMLDAGVSGVFQPHGLGHLIGLDVHDVGGYLVTEPARPTEPWLSKLRFARILKAGMYVTIEPGCYFIKQLLDKALANIQIRKYINVEMLERFRSFGGVRIEDDVLITKTGAENFAIVPRTVEEIEQTMASK